MGKGDSEAKPEATQPALQNAEFAAATKLRDCYLNELGQSPASTSTNHNEAQDTSASAAKSNDSLSKVLPSLTIAPDLVETKLYAGGKEVGNEIRGPRTGKPSFVMQTNADGTPVFIQEPNGSTWASKDGKNWTDGNDPPVQWKGAARLDEQDHLVLTAERIDGSRTIKDISPCDGMSVSGEDKSGKRVYKVDYNKEGTPFRAYHEKGSEVSYSDDGQNWTSQSSAMPESASKPDQWKDIKTDATGNLVFSDAGKFGDNPNGTMEPNGCLSTNVPAS